MRGRKEAQALGAVFPGYTGVAEIASGAFATVYRAVESGRSRPVALKVLRLADTSPRAVDTFDKELGALALLGKHPNVTTLYRTFYTPEGRPVMVLELCQESLAQRVRRNGPLGPAEVTAIGIKIAGALETAHRAGVLHRDMKPQNILFSAFGEPVLGNFGVAALQASAQSTEGVFGFTTLHAPPEALEGQPLSPSADIYGLASTMYQLLLGRGPFAAYEGEAPASVILRILRDPAPRPPADAVPEALADLLEAALAKEPSKRPQSALEFAEALRDIESRAGWPITQFVMWGHGPTPLNRAGAPPSTPLAPPPAVPSAYVPTSAPPPPALARVAGAPASWVAPQPSQRVELEAPGASPITWGPPRPEQVVHLSLPAARSAPVPGPAPASPGEPASDRPEPAIPDGAPPWSALSLPAPGSGPPTTPVGRRRRWAYALAGALALAGAAVGAGLLAHLI